MSVCILPFGQVHTLKITPKEFPSFDAVRKKLVSEFRLDESEHRMDEDETHVYFERAVAQIWQLNPFHDARIADHSREAWVVNSEKQWQQATKDYPWDFNTWARKAGVLAVIGTIHLTGTTGFNSSDKRKSFGHANGIQGTQLTWYMGNRYG